MTINTARSQSVGNSFESCNVASITDIQATKEPTCTTLPCGFSSIVAPRLGRCRLPLSVSVHLPPEFVRSAGAKWKTIPRAFPQIRYSYLPRKGK